jgi:hypothetical protein
MTPRHSAWQRPWIDDRIPLFAVCLLGFFCWSLGAQFLFEDPGWRRVVKVVFAWMSGAFVHVAVVETALWRRRHRNKRSTDA